LSEIKSGSTTIEFVEMSVEWYDQKWWAQGNKDDGRRGTWTVYEGSSGVHQRCDEGKQAKKRERCVCVLCMEIGREVGKACGSSLLPD
jgi:hypothetical protein